MLCKKKWVNQVFCIAKKNFLEILLCKISLFISIKRYFLTGKITNKKLLFAMQICFLKSDFLTCKISLIKGIFCLAKRTIFFQHIYPKKISIKSMFLLFEFNKICILIQTLKTLWHINLQYNHTITINLSLNFHLLPWKFCLETYYKLHKVE